jgi:hypothetical protein
VVTKESSIVALAVLVVFGAACGTGRTPHRTAAAHPTSTTSFPPTTTSTAAGAATGATASSVSACTTSHLTLSYGGGTGAGGTTYWTFYFTNNGQTTCSLEGYPGVAVLDASGDVVQHPARRGALGTHAPVPVTLVVLGPGQRASFLVTSIDNVPNPDCPSEFTGTTLQVYPPNQTAAIRQSFSGGFCDLGVGPVQAG